MLLLFKLHVIGVTFKSKFGNQFIGNISFIRIDDTLVMNNHLFKRNVFYISDFFDKYGNPMEYDRFIRRFQIDKFPFSLYFG